MSSISKEMKILMIVAASLLGCLMLGCGGCVGLVMLGRFGMAQEEQRIAREAAEFDGDYVPCTTVVWSFQENESSASQAWNGHHNGYEGIVRRIDSDYLVIVGDDEKYGDDCWVYGIDPSDQARLSKGDKVKFYGRCDGVLAFGDVIFRDAILTGIIRASTF